MTIDKVKEMLSNQLNIEVDKINENSKIVEDLGVNSIGLVYLAVAVEEEFEVDMANASLESFKTVQDVIDYIKG